MKHTRTGQHILATACDDAVACKQPHQMLRLTEQYAHISAAAAQSCVCYIITCSR